MTTLGIRLEFPELIFGIAGPIGIEIDEIVSVLASSLAGVYYSSHEIKITDHYFYWSKILPVVKPTEPNFHSEIMQKMDYANALCRHFGDPSTMAKVAVLAIQRFRAKTGEETRPIPKTAFVVRQLKRPEEVTLLRSIYGRQFILISAYGSVEDRRRNLRAKIEQTMPISATEIDVRQRVDELIFRDSNEDDNIYGQHLRDTFHLADVFVDGMNKKVLEHHIDRFVTGVFGRTDIAPTKAEYGMYAAKSAALRSSDLSRQVGAAIFTTDGDLITQGCNEVPRAGGGTYWDSEQPDYRDVKLGHDPNDLAKREILRDLLERLRDNKFLSKRALNIGSSSHLLEHLLDSGVRGEEGVAGLGALVDSTVTDVTEYGRVVHAEMNAICDAARLGRAVKGGILFCTTFPCHHCTKHIISVGLQEVVYMEPYPKSRAQQLHEHEIELESGGTRYSHNIQKKVAFVPFLGISPYRYRDIFQKAKRKRDGKALDWVEGSPKPLVEAYPTYLELEAVAISSLYGTTETSETGGES